MRVSARVEQVSELLELRGSTRGITSAVRLHVIFVSDRRQSQPQGEARHGPSGWLAKKSKRQQWEKQESFSRHF
jgi:hypothetical protein